MEWIWSTHLHVKMDVDIGQRVHVRGCACFVAMGASGNATDRSLQRRADCGARPGEDPRGGPRLARCLEPRRSSSDRASGLGLGGAAEPSVGGPELALGGTGSLELDVGWKAKVDDRRWQVKLCV